MSLENFYEHSLKSGVFLLLLLGCGQAEPGCRNARCQADILINKASPSQPQEEDCQTEVIVYYLEYQTLSVDTKNLRLNVRLLIQLDWMDPSLAWHYDYGYGYGNFYYVVLPTSKIWTPEIQVANAIQSEVEHTAKDVVVHPNGYVEYAMVITAEVNCALNMFNYPFSSDECPVGLRTWSVTGCGTKLNVLFNISMVDSSRGDWETKSAVFKKLGPDKVPYIMVSLKIRHFNPFITLMLPTILIVLVDVISFFLPLGGGERNCFKVTLVLSLVLLLTILDEKLPGGSECSPIIRLHYCVCMVMLVVSMLGSMALTGIAKDGVAFCRCAKKCASKTEGDETDKEDEETKDDVSVAQLNEPPEEKQMLRKLLVNFLEGFRAKEKKNECRHSFANTLDKIFFWLYLIGATLYFCAMIYVMARYLCNVGFDPFYWADKGSNSSYGSQTMAGEL